MIAGVVVLGTVLVLLTLVLTGVIRNDSYGERPPPTRLGQSPGQLR